MFKYTDGNGKTIESTQKLPLSRTRNMNEYLIWHRNKVSKPHKGHKVYHKNYPKIRKKKIR